MPCHSLNCSGRVSVEQQPLATFRSIHFCPIVAVWTIQTCLRHIHTHTYVFAVCMCWWSLYGSIYISVSVCGCIMHVPVSVYTHTHMPACEYVQTNNVWTCVCVCVCMWVSEWECQRPCVSNAYVNVRVRPCHWITIATLQWPRPRPREI